MPGQRSLRLVFTTVGSRGDVQPMLALALHAQGRGHDVLLAASPDFGDWVRAAGVPYAPLGQDIQAFLAANPEAMTSNARQMLAIVTRYFADEVPRQVEQLLVLLEGA